MFGERARESLSISARAGGGLAPIGNVSSRTQGGNLAGPCPAKKGVGDSRGRKRRVGHGVLVQSEMEKNIFPLVKIPPLRGGDFQGMRIHRPMPVCRSFALAR
jgi:hypothetical protein